MRDYGVLPDGPTRDADRTSSSTPTAPAPAIPGRAAGARSCVRRHEKELNGGEPHTTNNRMELMAAISALEALKGPARSICTPTASMCSNGITEWIHGWKRNGWRTADKKPVKNIDLWQRLDAAISSHDVRWHWVKGHAGHELQRARRPAGA